MDRRLLLRSGTAQLFTVAGLGVRFQSELEEQFVLPAAYEPFESVATREDLVILVDAREELEPADGVLLYDSGVHWRLIDEGQQRVFEVLHPPTSRVYCQAHVDRDFARANVVFGERVWQSLGGGSKYFPYPLDQLLFVPRLAQADGFLLHAAGALFDDRALVFAGHSGDGKTTLAKLLEAEGVSLLSDERVAVRRTPSGFVAHGTPWAGEGNVVSTNAARLEALYLLKKSPAHEVRGAGSTALPEILSRAIVPYYLPGIVSCILDVLASLATSVSIRELHFARKAGLTSLLREAA